MNNIGGSSRSIPLTSLPCRRILRSPFLSTLITSVDRRKLPVFLPLNAEFERACSHRHAAS
jgi:hypothetical protein